MAVSEAAGEDVRLRHRRQRRRRLGAGAPADRGAGRHGLRAGGRPAGPASLHPRAGRLHQDAVQPGLHLAVQDRAVRGQRRPADSHHAGPHARRVQLDQRHDLQPRPARRSRQLGAARQSRLGLCRYAALLQAHRAADRHRRRPHPWPRGQPAGHRHRLDPSDLRGVHRRRRRHGDPALRRLQQRRPPGGRRLFPARDPSRLAAFGGARVPASGEGDRPAGDTHRCARRRGAVRRQACGRRALCQRSRPHRRSTSCRRGAR